MATLFEYNTIVSTSFNRQYLAQTFTPQDTHYITSIVLQLQRWNPGGDMDNALVINIEETTDGLPNGTVLTSNSSIMPADIAANPNWSSVEVAFAVNVTLYADTMYAITLEVPDYVLGNIANWKVIYWRINQPSSVDAYTGGIAYEKVGDDWVLHTSGTVGKRHLHDFWFQDWGEAGTAPPSDLQSFIPDRPDAYDPDLFWVPGLWAWDGDVGDYVFTDGAWAEYGALIAIGGGRYNQQLVAVGHNCVYFEEYS